MPIRSEPGQVAFMQPDPVGLSHGQPRGRFMDCVPGTGCPFRCSTLPRRQTDFPFPNLVHRRRTDSLSRNSTFHAHRTDCPCRNRSSRLHRTDCRPRRLTSRDRRRDSPNRSALRPLPTVAGLANPGPICHGDSNHVADTLPASFHVRRRSLRRRRRPHAGIHHTAGTGRVGRSCMIGSVAVGRRHGESAPTRPTDRR